MDFCNIAKDFERSVSLSRSTFLLVKSCVCEFVAATDFSVLDVESLTGIAAATRSVSEQEDEDNVPVGLFRVTLS